MDDSRLPGSALPTSGLPAIHDHKLLVTDEHVHYNDFPHIDFLYDRRHGRFVYYVGPLRDGRPAIDINVYLERVVPPD